MTVLCAALACLRLFPSRSQFFMYESVTLSCEGNFFPEWRVRRNTSKKINELCPSYSINESTCTFSELYETDSGVYWCESAAGERSNEVNITVTGGELILVSPEPPVTEGENLILQCRVRTKSLSSSILFYKNGVLVGNSLTGNFTIRNVSKSDEGFYKCNASGVADSPESWLAVRGRIPQTPTAPLAHILLPVVACCLLLIVLMLLCRWRNHKGGVNRAASYTVVTISRERKPLRITDIDDVPTLYSSVMPDSSR